MRAELPLLIGQQPSVPGYQHSMHVKKSLPSSTAVGQQDLRGEGTGLRSCPSARESDSLPSRSSSTVVSYLPEPGGLGLRGTVGIAVALLHGLAMAWLLWGGSSEATPTPAPDALMVMMIPASEPPAAPPASPPKQKPPLLTSKRQLQPAPQAPVVTPPQPMEPASPEPVAKQSPLVAPMSESSPAPPASATVPPQNVRLAYLNNPKPTYPEHLRRRGIEGKNHVRVLVSPEGRVLQVELQRSSGNAELDAAAVTAVQRWKFAPFLSAQPAWAVIPFDFKLEK